MKAATTNRPLAGKRVLVLEDEYLIGLEVADVIEMAGATVLGPAESIEAALALLDRKDEGPHLAVLDVNLSGARSYSVADALAERGVPFLFVTGYQTNSMHVAYNGYPRIEKPFGERALLSALLALASRQDSWP